MGSLGGLVFRGEDEEDGNTGQKLSRSSTISFTYIYQ